MISTMLKIITKMAKQQREQIKKKKKNLITENCQNYFLPTTATNKYYCFSVIFRAT